MLPANVVTHFADRLQRLHHAVWHGVRNSWSGASGDVRQWLRKLGWTPPRPSIELAPVRPAISSGAGEDFLFMHRQMVDTCRRLMAAAGATPVVWATIPAPGNADADVPAAWSDPADPVFTRRLAALKTDGFYWSRMKSWDLEFKDPTYLATLKLGELGALLEFGVHNDMHMRWSAIPRDPETNAPLVGGRLDGDVSPKWDLPRYDFLGEFYSSQVNPLFWRLHGWIDDRVEDWFSAHEARHPGQVVRRSTGGVPWFEPGAWVQVDEPWSWPKSIPGMEHIPDEHGVSGKDRDKLIENMVQVMGVLYPPPRYGGELPPELGAIVSAHIGRGPL